MTDTTPEIIEVPSLSDIKETLGDIDARTHYESEVPSDNDAEEKL